LFFVLLVVSVTITFFSMFDGPIYAIGLCQFDASVDQCCPPGHYQACILDSGNDSLCVGGPVKPLGTCALY
jgi:hypothetical protein